MYDAMKTAQGKPGSPLRLVIIGTLAPATGGWWHDLIADGTRGKTYVQALTGKADKWADLREIRRCNPLTSVSPEFLDKLKEERPRRNGIPDYGRVSLAIASICHPLIPPRCF